MSAQASMLFKNYAKAKIHGKQSGDFDIMPVEEGKYDKFYVLIKPNVGIYRDQYQILEMKTVYGAKGEYKFPASAPYLRFLTKVYHTNIYTTGTICLDILKQADKWMPSYGFVELFISIMLLYQEPNTSSPAHPAAASAYSKYLRHFQNSKKSTMSFQEIEELKEKCFKPYKNMADAYASDNKIQQYAKYFPQINGEEGYIDLEEVTEQLEFIEARARAKREKMKDSRKKKQTNKKAKWAKYQHKK
jgi:ubiquitin-protein ligase